MKEWSVKVAFDYLDKFDKALDNLENSIYKGTFDENLNSYKYLVVPQIYIFYKFIDIDTILITTIWNNYKKPFWLD